MSGTRTFDVNVDGVAHYGLYPDWIEDLRVQAGDEIVADLARGSEAYLQMWERALGVPGPGCRDAADLAGLRAGMNPEEVLRTAGQPRQRTGARFTYCQEGGGTEMLSFDATGHLLLGAPRGADPVAPVAPAGSAVEPRGTLPATGGPASALPLLSSALLALALHVRRSVRVGTSGRAARREEDRHR